MTERVAGRCSKSHHPHNSQRIQNANQHDPTIRQNTQGNQRAHGMKYAAWALLILLSLLTVISGLKMLGAYARPHPAVAVAKPRVHRVRTPPPDTLPPIDLPWPAGWEVTPDDGSQRPYSEQITARLKKHGKVIASIDASIGWVDPPGSLDDFIDLLIAGDISSAKKGGQALATPVPEHGTWRGHPTVQYEIAYVSHGDAMRRRLVATKGSGSLLCLLTIKATGKNFEKNLPRFERLMDQFPCP